MSRPTLIHFLRHGRVENPDNLFYGHLPGFGLSELGRAQAQAAAGVLAKRPLAAIFASPLQRAQETVKYVSAYHPHLAVQTTDLIIEIRIPFDGHPEQELVDRGWDSFAGNEPPFEQPADIVRRMRKFIDRTLEDYRGCEVAAITHGDPLALTMLWALGQPVQSKVRLPLYKNHMATGSITTFTFDGVDGPLPRVQYRFPYATGERAVDVTVSSVWGDPA